MSYNRSKETKRRLIKNYNETKNSYGAGTWYDEKKERYRRYSCHSTYVKHLCRRSTRRRLKNSNYISSEKGSYKKIYDYWWTIL